MRKVIAATLISIALTACGTANYHYQSEDNPQVWIGKNITEVQKRWGSADQIFNTGNGTTYYVYTTTSGRNFFASTSTNFSLVEAGEDFPLRGQMGLKCSAIFKTNQNNIIISTSHIGSNCGGEWAPNS